MSRSIMPWPAVPDGAACDRSWRDMALNQNRRQVFELLVSQKDSRPLPRLVNIVDLVQTRGIPTRAVQKAQLNSYAQHKEHSQVVLKCSRLRYLDLPEDSLPRLSVMMDQLTDPQNVGSIVQTCHFMGVALLGHKKNKCALTPTLSKISGGALEMMDVYQLDEDNMRDMKEQGFVFIAAGTGKDSIDIKDWLDDYPEIEFFPVGPDAFYEPFQKLMVEAGFSQVTAWPLSLGGVCIYDGHTE